jgi:hypothetical protein
MSTVPSRRAQERPLKIACVYTSRCLSNEVVGAMNMIRFVRMSEALARRGHEVHVVVNGTLGELLPAGGPVEVQSRVVHWDDYDVVKTFFHSGFAALDTWGGADHPFIVSNLGSVVGAGDVEGVYFFDKVRDDLWDIQRKIAGRSRVISILTDRSLALWRRMHGEDGRVLPVPTGVDADVPGRGENPYAARGITGPVALYAGNIYSRDRQPGVNLFWQARLNALGRALGSRGMRLVAMGPGAVDHLDPSVVTHVGIVDFRDVWNWQWHAGVGIVLAQGAVQDNESSKIYYYLRTGLPVACEAPVPNAWLVSHTGHGTVVEYDADDVSALAEAAAQLARRPPAANGVVPYVIANHSWDARAAAYAFALAEIQPD